MINEQTSGQLRQLLQALGAVATTLGFATTGQVDAWITIAMQISGPLAMIGGVLWSWKVNRPVDLIASVDAMAKDPNSPVKAVVVADTKEGRELASTMTAGTVVAGTSNAQVIATR